MQHLKVGLFSFVLTLFLSAGISFADYTISTVYSNQGEYVHVEDIENNQIVLRKRNENLPGSEIFLYDGYGVAQITFDGGNKRALLSGGTVYWRKRYFDSFELFQYKNGSVTSIPKGQGEQDYLPNFIADAGNLAWIRENRRSGDWEVLLYDGHSTSVLASGGAIKDNIDLDGQTAAWVEQPNREEYIWNVVYYDGAAPTKVASASSIQGPFVQDGTVYWLEDKVSGIYELYAWNGGVTKQLTNNGGSKTWLSVDSGVIAWVEATSRSRGTLYVYENNQVQLVMENVVLPTPTSVSGSAVVWRQFDVGVPHKSSIMKYEDGETKLVATSPVPIDTPLINNGYIAWANNNPGDYNYIETVNLATPTSGRVLDLGPEHDNKDIKLSGAATLQVSEWTNWETWTPSKIVVRITHIDGQRLDGITVTTSEGILIDLSNYSAKVTLPYTGAPIHFQIETPGPRGVSATWWAE